MSTYVLSRHAVDRYAERVLAGQGGRARAQVELLDLVASGKLRPRPRHWTHARALPGRQFVYSAFRPGVVAVIEFGVVVTVMTRDLGRGCGGGGRRRGGKRAPRR